VPDRRLATVAVLVVGAATLLHVGYAGLIAVAPQEAYYWEWARRLDLSYFDHPPLAAWTIALTTGVFGNSERALRLAAALHSAIFCAFWWLAIRRLFGARVALVALAGALIVPLFALGQVIVTPDAPLLSGWAMALYFTVRALDEERPQWLLAAGAATGWALLGKYTGALLLPQILLALFLDPRGRRMLRTPWPWAGAALALLLFSPVIAWNVQHGLASFAFQTEGRVAHASFRPLRIARFLGLQAALVTPILLVLAIEAIAQAFRRRADPSFRVCAIFSAPLLLIAASASPFIYVKGNWIAPIYPTAFAAAAALAISRSGWRRRAGVAGVALALAGSAYVHLVPLHPSVPFPAREEGSAGWRALAARVDAERAALGPDAFVAGCNYKVSAELAYYLPGHPRTWSAEIAGDHGLQYRYWFDPAELAGREGILVLDPREKGTCARRAEACRPLEPLPPLEVKRGAATVTTFQLWRCRYAGAPPALAGAALAPPR
jgi:4-amino-4-deoxy-L-arabinose transferase-like glycosyltransferase